MTLKQTNTSYSPKADLSTYAVTNLRTSILSIHTVHILISETIDREQRLIVSMSVRTLATAAKIKLHYSA